MRYAYADGQLVHYLDEEVDTGVLHGVTNIVSVP